MPYADPSKHKDIINANARRRRSQNIEESRRKDREKAQKYAENHPQKLTQRRRLQSKREIETLSDNYIKHLLTRYGTNLTKSDIPQELVELKRATLQLKREIR